MKYSIKIPAALFTFIVGIGTFFCWNFYFADLPNIEIQDEGNVIACSMFPTKVSICHLYGSFDIDDGKWITTEATLYAAASGENVLSPIDQCRETGSGDLYFTFLELKNFKELYKTLRISEPYYKEADVRVTGTVKKNFR